MLRKKNALTEYAKLLGIRKVSALNKAALAEKICEVFLDKDQLFYRLSILDDHEMMLFRAAISAPIPMSEKNYAGLMRLNMMDLAIIYEDGCARVLEDVARAYQEIDESKLDPYRKKASWVYRCLHWCENMYGVFPVDIFVDVINSKRGMKVTAAEAVDIFDRFPNTEVLSFLYENLFIAIIYVVDIEAFEELRRKQADKDYYIPGCFEIEELYDTDTLITDKAYQELKAFLIKKIGWDEERTEYTLLDMWLANAYDGDFHDTLEGLMEEIVFKNEKQAETAINLFMNALNNTRMLQNRGHKPIEIIRKKPFGPGNMPTIVPVSSMAAEMLSQAAPDIRKMGFGLDLEANADIMTVTQGSGDDKTITQKKIYPNDPCPCGSGKKYKKCCGRNRTD